DAFAVATEDVEELVVLGDGQAVAVDEHPHDGALRHLVEQVGQLRVERRLPTTEHEDVDAPVLPGEAGIDRGEHLLERHHRGQGGRGGGEAGRALQVAAVEQV